MRDDLLAAALAFVADGLPVFPCEPRGKRPLVEGGFKAATLVTEQIRAWWSTWRLANIGIPTGAVSGFVALDIDPGGDDSLAELTHQYAPLPETRVVKTGRGRQLWFESPGVPIGCKAGFRRGLDFRGDGGYVIAPPSLHANGKRYTFLNKSKPVKIPDWLIKIIQQGKSAPNPTPPANGSSGKIREGSRNATLASIAGTMRKRGLGETAIRAALLEHNSRECDPPLPEAEVATIAASFAKYPPGAASPPSGTQPKGFSLVRLGELLAQPEVPVDWLWQGRLAAGTVAAVVSKPKVGKSTFARNLCLAVSRGEEFLGLSTKGGLCIYLALEERAEDVTADFRAMGAKGDEQIFVHADAIPSAGIFALLGLVQERKPVLVVIDPLFRMIHVKDEKAYAEGYKALGPLIDIARATGTLLLVTHHSGKALKADAIDSPLGTTAIGGAVNSLIVLKRTEAYRTIQTVQRLGEWMPETVLQFDSESRRLSVGGTRFEAERQECEEAIVEFLKAAGEGKTEPEIDERVDGKTTLKRKALRAGFEKGRVTREGSGKKGDPYKYSFPCSNHIVGTRERESEKAAQARTDTGETLVPKSAQETLLVPEEKTGPKTAISGEAEAVRNVAEGSTFAPPSEGESAVAPKPVEVDRRWRF